MKMRILAALMLVSLPVFGAGFRLTEGAARASGMGNAVTALTDDATSIYFNPAGLAGHKGIDASAGISLIFPSVSFKNASSGVSTATLSSVATPLNAYLSYGVTEQFSLGLGVSNPFGASARWPADWEGAGRSLSSSVQTFNINPTMAFMLHPRFRVGGGIQVMRGTVLIERAFNFVDQSGAVKLGGGAWGLGWNAGVQVDVVEKLLTIGASYRSSVDMAFAGRAAFSNVPGEFRSLLADQPITADITLPGTIAVGVGLKASDALRFGLDVSVTSWDSFKALTIAFENPALTNPLPKNWWSVGSVHVGGEYDVSRAFKARLGLVYDPSASRGNTLTPDLPDATRFRFSVGAGWRADFGLTVDAAYQFVLLSPSVSTAPGFGGTYAGSASIVSVNVGYRM